MIRPPSLMSRRSALFVMAGGLSGLTAGVYNPLKLRTRHIPSPAPAFRGTRIVLVSDIHRSDLVPSENLGNVLAMLREARPDLLLLGGDLISAESSDEDMLREVLQGIGRVPAPLGRYVVPGNHEHASGFTPLLDRPEYGIQTLLNRGVRIKKGEDALFLAGLDDSGTGRPDPIAAFQERRDEPVLLISHNPDVFIDLDDRLPPVWLAVAGHLHGGQVRLPFLGPLILPTEHPEFFDRGWSRGTRFPVYVTTGTGVVKVPWRFFCPPEVVLFVCS